MDVFNDFEEIRRAIYDKYPEADLGNVHSYLFFLEIKKLVPRAVAVEGVIGLGVKILIDDILFDFNGVGYTTLNENRLAEHQKLTERYLNGN